MAKIVAEISANHEGSLEKALELVRLAKDSGADFVKFQVFNPDEMALSNIDAPPPFKGNLADLYRMAETPKRWIPDLFSYANSIGIVPFASVFDSESLHFVAAHKPPYIKIASLESTHWPLIKEALATNIPLIISTGGMNYAEWLELDRMIHSRSPTSTVTYLVCSAAYPATWRQTKLGAIAEMRRDSLCYPTIGFSDHAKGYLSSMLAVACGAGMVEKHIALSEEALDGSFSSIGADFRIFCDKIRDVSRCIATGIESSSGELRSFRRAIYATHEINRGDMITDANAAILRGKGGGAHPKYWDEIIGRKSMANYQIGDGIQV